MLNIYAANEKVIKQVMGLPQLERENLKTKLKAELKEFRERERIYIEKRQELKDLEFAYRKKQD